MTKNKQIDNRIKRTSDEKILCLISYIIVAFFTVICFYPFWNVLINSIATKQEVNKGIYLFPSNPYFGVYKQIIRKGDVPHAMFISISRTAIVTVANVFLTSMFAYLVTQQKMLFRKFVYRFAIVTMHVGGGLIPWYLVMKAYGLYNNFWVYVIPNLLGVYNAILVKTYIESLPTSLEEAAHIDGAGFVTTYVRIILPLCKPILATIALYVAVGQWNSYRDNFLLVQKSNLQTMQMILYSCIHEAEATANAMVQAALTGIDISSVQIDDVQNNITTDAVRNATTVISMLPIMCLYPFLQKYFAKGIMIGAVKG